MSFPKCNAQSWSQCSSWGLLDANWSGKTCLFIQPSGVFGFCAVLWCSLLYPVCCLFSLQLFLVNLLPYQSSCIMPFCPWAFLMRWSRHLSKMVLFLLLFKADSSVWLKLILTSRNTRVTCPNTALPANLVGVFLTLSRRRSVTTRPKPGELLIYPLLYT